MSFLNGDHLLVDGPCRFDLDVLVGRERCGESLGLLVGEQIGSGVCGVRPAEDGGLSLRPRCPRICCSTRRRQVSRAAPVSRTTWTWSITAVASGRSSVVAVRRSTQRDQQP